MKPRQLTTNGMMALIVREGSREKAYRDASGLLTIGVGHLLTKSEITSGKIKIGSREVRWRDGLDDDMIAALLDQDNNAAEAAVSNLVAVPLADHQFDALVSFVFNVGVGAFKRSTLLKKLNHGEYEAVPQEMRRWIWSGGRPILKSRRESEIEQWRSPYVKRH